MQNRWWQCIVILGRAKPPTWYVWQNYNLHRLTDKPNTPFWPLLQVNNDVHSHNRTRWLLSSINISMTPCWINGRYHQFHKRKLRCSVIWNPWSLVNNRMFRVRLYETGRKEEIGRGLWKSKRYKRRRLSGDRNDPLQINTRNDTVQYGSTQYHYISQETRELHNRETTKHFWRENDIK